ATNPCGSAARQAQAQHLFSGEHASRDGSRGPAPRPAAVLAHPASVEDRLCAHGGRPSGQAGEKALVAAMATAATATVVRLADAVVALLAHWAVGIDVARDRGTGVPVLVLVVRFADAVVAFLATRAVGIDMARDRGAGVRVLVVRLAD